LGAHLSKLVLFTLYNLSVNYKQGIHFKLVDKMMEVLEEVEECHQQRKNMKNYYKETMKLSRNTKGSTKKNNVINEGDLSGEEDDD
jgi:hypothetical protein